MTITGVDGLIGRLFQQNQAQEPYQNQADQSTSSAVAALGATPEAQRDKVDLSENAPRPLVAKSVERANEIAQKISLGETITPNEMKDLRKDRVFAAVMALSALKIDGRAGQVWPGGLPAPTGSELSLAYRRVAQRMQRIDDAKEPRQVQQTRQELLDHFKEEDFNSVSDMIGGEE